MSDTKQYKLVLLGDTAVGKSSLVLRFCKHQFFEHNESTIGASFLQAQFNIDEAAVKYEIWDTAGQERYASLAPMYYRGASAAIVVADVTSRPSFLRARKWVNELRSQVSGDGVVIAFALNKTDLEEQATVEADEAISYCESEGLLFYKTSAKANTGVTSLFHGVARELLKRGGPAGGPKASSVRLMLPDDDKQGKKKKGCC